jgi:hypothetical protein
MIPPPVLSNLGSFFQTPNSRTDRAEVGLDSHSNKAPKCLTLRSQWFADLELPMQEGNWSKAKDRLIYFPAIACQLDVRCTRHPTPSLSDEKPARLYEHKYPNIQNGELVSASSRCWIFSK